MHPIARRAPAPRTAHARARDDRTAAPGVCMRGVNGAARRAP